MHILAAIVLAVVGMLIAFLGLMLFDQGNEAIRGRDLEAHQVAFIDELLQISTDEKILWLFSWPYEINDSAGVITTQRLVRYWKVRKGSYPEIRRLSEESIWPFFEKTGARIMGMWKVEPPPGEEGPSDYDEVYLLTRYASFDHWKATRDMVGLGGNGPDFEAAIDAVKRRHELSTETRVTFLKGGPSDGRPYFMPGMAENYEESEG